MNRRLAVLGPPDVQRSRATELDLRPFQVAYLGRPQAMPERNQDQGRVAVTIPTVPARFDQLLDFLRREVFTGPKLGVAREAAQNLREKSDATQDDHP
jgi:hypothetical protein